MKSMIKLLDLINLAGLSLNRFKIHCATGKNQAPLEAFFDGKFKEWQEYQNQHNFQCDEIISLIYLSGDKWLFAGIFAVLGVKERKKGNKILFQYSTEEQKLSIKLRYIKARNIKRAMPNASPFLYSLISCIVIG